MPSDAPKISPFHVGIAAEAFVAALCARCGYDVSVQYGANQPEYDLAIIRCERMLKVSVKGNSDGAWPLAAATENANYHGAIDNLLAKHKPRTVICLVQFCETRLMEIPRVYLATPSEVAAHMKSQRKGLGDSCLWERKSWGPRSQVPGWNDEIPAAWRFSPETIDRLMATA